MDYCSKYSVNKNDNKTISDYDWDFKEDCRIKCKPNCIQETYEFELREIDDNELSKKFKAHRNQSDSSHTDFSYITVLAKNSDETHLQHSPKMKLTDFLCNIGGLFSLWLGMSVISIFDYLMATILALNSKLKLYLL